LITINGFLVEQVRGPKDGDPPCWQIFLSDDPHGMIASCNSFDAAIQWAHQPQLHQLPSDQHWFFTLNERGERLMMRAERASKIARHIIEQEKKCD
jgi:hypothetical protein